VVSRKNKFVTLFGSLRERSIKKRCVLHTFARLHANQDTIILDECTRLTWSGYARTTLSLLIHTRIRSRTKCQTNHAT